MALDPDGMYIGWSEDTPPWVGRFLVWLVPSVLLAGLLLAALIAAAQQTFGPGRFEYGVTRVFEGEVQAWPVPSLLVDRPGRAPVGQRRSAWILVDQGKHGAGPRVAPLDGRRVQLRGALVYRGDQTLVVLSSDPLVDVGPGAAPPAVQAMGSGFFDGEIVDSKCFLGVMNPGNLKPHRACATRCISGGIPPMFLVRQPDGASRQLLLVGPQGEAINQQVLEYVAEPIRVPGDLQRVGSQWVLRVDPRNIRRL